MILFDKPLPATSSHPNDLFLHHLSADSLIHRLSLIKRKFQQALVVGRGAHPLVMYLEEQGCSVITNKHYASGHPVIFYEEFFPFKEGTFDLICCNLNLHWINDLPGVLNQMRFLLRPDSLFLGSFLGQETLKELRESFLYTEIKRNMGVRLHIAPMIHLSTAAALLQRAQFVFPVADYERQMVSYLSPWHLMKDLKRMGETNRSIYRAKTFYPPQAMQEMANYYTKKFSQDNRIQATYDLCYVLGWTPEKQ